MSRPFGRRLRAGLVAGSAMVALTAGAGVATARAARTPAPVSPSAQAPPPPNPATEVLAIVSPLALPACGASGTATLLVPILGGVLQSQLHLPKSISVGDLVLNALGPVYVVCGDLPSTSGSQCSLDDQIAAVWPASLPSEGLLAPSPVGDILDSIAAALKLLNLPPTAAFEQALHCRVRSSSGAPKAPPPAPGALPPVDAAPLSTPGVVADGGPTTDGPIGPAASRAPNPAVALGQPPTAAAPAPNLAAGRPLTFLKDRIPSWVTALQLMAAAALCILLAGSWLTSAQLRRRGRA